jgi:hypothetical protein
MKNPWHMVCISYELSHSLEDNYYDLFKAAPDCAGLGFEARFEAA